MEKPHDKLIKIPKEDNIFRDLSVLAAKADLRLEPFIIKLLVDHVEAARKNEEL